MHLGRGPSPLGKGPRSRETSTDPSHRDHREEKTIERAKSKDDRTGDLRVRTAKDDDDHREGPEARRELDPCSTPHRFLVAAAPRPRKREVGGKMFLCRKTRIANFSAVLQKWQRE